MENTGSPTPKTSQESVLSSRASCSKTSSNHPRNRSYLPKVSTEHVDACHSLPCMTGAWTATPMNVAAARSLALPWDGQDPVPHPPPPSRKRETACLVVKRFSYKYNLNNLA